MTGGVPAGAPTITCIAANSFVRTTAGGITGPTAGIGADPRNRKSLAFEVRFNDFRYYVGGDIETPQEDDIELLLNAADNADGRVHAMKASHHGANTATSRSFVDRMRPGAVIISCGTENSHRHPAIETVNVLDGYLADPQRHPAPPPEPPNRPILHYLTGFQVPVSNDPDNPDELDNPNDPDDDSPKSLRGDLGIAAGDPAADPPVPGHVRVTVTQAQSINPPAGRVYLAVQQVVEAVAANTSLPGAVQPIVAIGPAAQAAEAALSFGIADTARAVLSAFGQTPAQQQAAVATFNFQRPCAEIAAAITGAAMAAGVSAAIAAAAGAAAGSRRGVGLNSPVQASIRAALTQTGMPDAAASHAALLIVNDLTNLSSEDGLFTVSLYVRAAGDRDYLYA